ncbi:MAG TPA: hypothetical protein VLG49_00575, partial [Rhabdochlamydiaceae bacterium]|nr:hypothetical protein [Rhabdochlamydiaceae bacterium]
EIRDLKTTFKKSLCEVVEERWADSVAKSFYPILSISDEAEQIAAAQKWTEQYFVGADYFNKWEGFTFIHGKVVAKLQQKTLFAFHAYCHEMIQKKIEVMQTRAEKDPVSFGRMMKEAHAKLEKDPTSLSILEKEYVEFTKNLDCLTQLPVIYKKMELLRKCIWYGYTLQECHQPIIDNDTSTLIFERIFNKVLEKSNGIEAPLRMEFYEAPPKREWHKNKFKSQQH